MEEREGDDLKIIGINGSPRKNCNTATMLKSALDGASKQGAKTKLVHLYDSKFQGCTSCFACKRTNGHGVCAMKDEITPLLNELETVDAILLGSPIYAGNITGVMRCFLERAIFCNSSYKREPTTYYPRKIKVGFIYTMGTPEKYLDQYGSIQNLKFMENCIKETFGSIETLYSFDTYQFADYSKYDVTFDVEAKERQRKNQFPLDCENAFQMGARFTTGS